MPRRSTPERIDAARHAATRQRLIGQGATGEMAEAWIVAWEAHATRDGLPRDGRYWERGWAWITAERRQPYRDGNPIRDDGS